MTDGVPAAGSRPTTGRLVARYTVSRVLVFVVITAVLAAIGLGLVALTGHAVDWRSARPVVLVAAFIAAPLSMVASFFLLRREREALAVTVATRVERYRERSAARAAREDAYAEELARRQQAERPDPDEGTGPRTGG
jgi:Protein of unknown function (DUF4229)